MKFSTVLATMLFAAGTALAATKKYIITYPKGTDLSAAKQQLEADGMTVTWTYTLINALAVEGPETAMDKFQVWTEANGPKPEIEEDQTVRTQKTSAISSNFDASASTSTVTDPIVVTSTAESTTVAESTSTTVSKAVSETASTSAPTPAASSTSASSSSQAATTTSVNGGSVVAKRSTSAILVTILMVSLASVYCF